MRKIEAIIFDLDGTLYSFDERDESDYKTSKFGQTIRANCLRFFEERFSKSPQMAEKLYHDLSERYKGEVSLAVEKEFGIARGEYFACTWNMPVETFVTQNLVLLDTIESLSIRTGLLTAAPKVWAERVLRFLQVRDFFGEAVFTGDPDLRKPNPKAFLQLAEFWNLDPDQILSVGDQELSDIVPAKSLGMQTLRIAKRAKTQADYVSTDVVSGLSMLKKKGVL